MEDIPSSPYRQLLPSHLAKAGGLTRHTLDNYFNELELTLEVVTWKGHKHPPQVSSGVKSEVTVVGSVCAGEQCMSPMVIWDRKNLPLELAVGEVLGTLFSKGWIEQELFDLRFSALPVHPYSSYWMDTLYTNAHQLYGMLLRRSFISPLLLTPKTGYMNERLLYNSLHRALEAAPPALTSHLWSSYPYTTASMRTRYKMNFHC